MGRRKKKKKKKTTTTKRDGAAAPELTGYAQLVVETPVAVLDLHGLTAAQAQRRLADFIRTQSRISSGRVVHIVTGRGTHSEDGPVLPGVANSVLRDDFTDEVEMIAGLPGGGALAVRLA